MKISCTVYLTLDLLCLLFTRFPFLFSMALFSLYFAFKYVDQERAILATSCYVFLTSTVAVRATMASVLELLLATKAPHDKSRFDFPFGLFPEKHFTLSDSMAFILTITITLLYFYQSKPWYLNNIMGISLCFQGIKSFRLDNYKIGAIALVGVCFYEFMFAKKLDGFSKILLPRSLERDQETLRLKDFSSLELGEIMIPGFFLALLLRFDARHVAEKSIHASFNKPYFHWAFLAYMLGTTLFVTMVAQPALCFLVSLCLISPLLCGFARGEMKELFAYSDAEEEEAKEAKKDD